MICPYCKDEEGTKTNTHYLTDSIIRPALNSDGSNANQKGYYFDLSNNSGSIKFNFQRNTPQNKLEVGLGRKPNEDEIENAKIVPYSVNLVFCPICEKKFKEIENPFIVKVLPKFRNADLNDKKELQLNYISIIRKFFLLQIWRSAICNKTFNLDKNQVDKIRDLLIDDNANLAELKKIPLSITYLITNGDKENFTQNAVGFTNDINPSLIFMNDFIIQIFKSKEEIRFFDFHKLNDLKTFKKYINVDENKFIVNIKSNTERIEFLVSLGKQTKLEPMVKMLKENFKRMFFIAFSRIPSEKEIQIYLTKIFNEDKPLAVKYSDENLMNTTVEYIKFLIIKKNR